MKRLLFYALPSLIALTPALAIADPDRTRFYVGAGISFFGTGSADVEGSQTGFSGSSDDFDVQTANIHLGFELESGSRIQLGYSRFELDWDDATLSDDGDHDLSGLDLDWVLPFSGDSAITPYISLGVGYYQYDELENNSDKRDGFALNAGVGMLFEVAEIVELELGYKVKYLRWEDIELIGDYAIENSMLLHYAHAGARIKF